MKPKIRIPEFSGRKILAIGLAIMVLTVLAVEIRKTGTEPDLLEGKLTIVQGNSVKAIANPSFPEPKTKQRIKMVITAYSSTVCQTDNDPFTTASGTYVKDGIVANNLLPFGTKIRIPDVYGEKIFVVEDRMNRRKSYYHIDIWFPEYEQAVNFGAKNAYVEILES